MSPHHGRIAECALPIHPYQALPPPPSARPRRIPTRALCLRTYGSTHTRLSLTHVRVERIPRLLALPPRHQPVFFSREQCVRWPARARARGLDAERGRAYALLYILAHSRGFMDVVERGELDHDGCRHGWCRFSGERSLSPLRFYHMARAICSARSGS
jgi:hypothetical protein